MISWHRPGQKVVCIATQWRAVEKAYPRPALGEVVTISAVGFDTTYGVFFSLAEYDHAASFLPQDFRPVYPTIIDQLRRLDTSVPANGMPGRVREDEHV